MLITTPNLHTMQSKYDILSKETISRNLQLVKSILSRPYQKQIH